MKADMHMHTLMSDGELIPGELIRRCKVLGHDLIAITDHVDASNLEFVAPQVLRAAKLSDDEITVLPGVELTHVRPKDIARCAALARSLGIKWVVVHGETPVEPVEPGTNLAAAECPDVDVLAHPGFLTVEEAEIARDNDVCIEITGRMGHNITNGHVCQVAREAKAEFIIDSDAHAPEDLMSEDWTRRIALGAGLTEAETERAMHVTPYAKAKKYL